MKSQTDTSHVISPNSAVLVIKLKDLLLNSNLNVNSNSNKSQSSSDTVSAAVAGSSSSANIILNDIYAHIDSKNALDSPKRIHFIYAPKTNDSLKLLAKLNSNTYKSASSRDLTNAEMLIYNTRLNAIEIFLIFFVLFLWFLSIFCCYKRYSFLLCFHKPDIPYSKDLYKNSQSTNVDLDIAPMTASTHHITTKESTPGSHQHNGEFNEKDVNNDGTKSIRTNKTSQNSLVRFKDSGYYTEKKRYSTYAHYDGSKTSLELCRRKQSSMLTRPVTANLNSNSANALQERRAFINRKNNQKHFNLVSLDEGVLKYSKMNRRFYENSLQQPHSNLKSISDSSSQMIGAQHSYEDNISLICETPLVQQRSMTSSHTTATAPSVKTQMSSESSKRQINPLSSLKRHMFAQSRHSGAQTTYQSNGDQSDGSGCEATGPRVSHLSRQSTNLINSKQSTISKQSIIITPATPQQAPSQLEDPNLLNPKWIPALVRQTLLELHRTTLISKSDSNIKTRNKSNSSGSSVSPNEKKRKKPLSLQNSEDRSYLNSVNLTTRPLRFQLFDDLTNKNNIKG